MSQTKKSLESLLRKASQQEEASKIDLQPKLQAWKDHVNSLYSTIERWLKPASEKHYIDVTREIVTLNEEHVGSYRLQKLLLTVGLKKIEIVPVGMSIIGSRGRIDISGPKGEKVMLLLLGKNEDPQIKVFEIHRARETIAESKMPKQESGNLVWKVGQRQPSFSATLLTEEIFTEIIDQLLN